LKEGEKLKKL